MYYNYLLREFQKEENERNERAALEFNKTEELHSITKKYINNIRI